MTSFGYTLSGEEHSPSDLVENAQRAEDAGFDFVSMSDHFHPWTTAQGHSGFVWSVLGAIAATTTRIRAGVGVSCPTTRVHPAIVAQASATTSLLFGDRFFLGVGTGEALNEHILGDRWPTPAVRREKLVEAVGIIRRLWSGETVDHRGQYFEVENARLFDAPTTPPPIIVSGFGDDAVEMAARIGDGLWSHGTDPEPIRAYEQHGGTGPRYAQLDVCWAEREDTARGTVHHVWPTEALPGQLAQDLPTWTHFEEAAKLVTQEEATKSIPCGPAVGPFVESVHQYVDAGFDHLYFHQIGPDQRGFLEFWTTALQPALDGLGNGSSAPSKGDGAMPGRSSHVKNEKQYEALKDKGMSKDRAARIANSPDASKHGGERSHRGGGNSKQGGTTAQHKAAGRKGGKAASRKR
jgi:G6PDH family F420-dependent oxidoreductase